MSLDNIDDLFKELDELEEKEPIKVSIPPRKQIVETPKPRTVRIKTFKVPDFNALLKFCEQHLDDYEIEQFYKHTIPRVLHKEKFGVDRGGGGWSGAVKATINILRKMKEDGAL